jgi:hypothetical protein
MQTRRYRKRGGEGIDGISNFFGSLSQKANEAKTSGLDFFGSLKKNTTAATSGFMGNTPPVQPSGGKRKKRKSRKRRR